MVSFRYGDRYPITILGRIFAIIFTIIDYSPCINVIMVSFRYGDRYPITILGRIFAIIWALVGITMSSIMIGAICSNLTITIVQEFGAGVARGITVSTCY